MKKMKTILVLIVAVILCSTIVQNTARATDDDNNIITYIAVAKPYLEVPDTQNIVIGVKNISNITKASVEIENQTTKEVIEVECQQIQEDALVFEISYEATQRGIYNVKSLKYTMDSEEEIIILSDYDINPQYGVNEAVETNPDAVTVENEANIDDSSVTEEQVELQVVKFDENGNTVSENTIEDALNVNALGEEIQSYSVDRSRGDVGVVIDPGHGGSDSGAVGNGYYEKDLNLKISQYLRDELEQYGGVKVYMTRDNDSYVSLTDRTDYANRVGADLFVCIHLNSGSTTAYGAEVYYPNANYRPDVSAAGKEVSQNILNQLSNLGIYARGILTRDSTNDERYPDGSLSDYYSVICSGKEYGFPSIIVEHAFLSNSGDTANYLSSDEKLKKLALADANGIVQYFGLEKIPVVDVADGTYYINSLVDLTKTVSIQGASTENKANIQLDTNTNSAMQRYEIVYVGDGYYKIENEATGKVLDVTDLSTASGANLQQYQWENSDSQLWKFLDAGNGNVYIKSKLGTCIDVFAGSSAEGTNIQLYSLNRSTAQQWFLQSAEEKPIEDGNYMITSAVDNSKVLEVEGSNYDNLGNVLLGEKKNYSNQQLKISYVGMGYYKVIFNHSEKALDVYAGDLMNGANVEQYDYNGSNAQLWKFVDAGNGAYYIKSKLGTCIDLPGGSTTAGTNIQTYSMNMSDAQKWVLEKAPGDSDEDRIIEDGEYTIESGVESGKVLDVYAGSGADGANIQIYEGNGSSAQRFSVTYVKNGYYKIISKSSNKSLDVFAGSAANGINLQQYEWNESDAQLWKFVDAGDGTYYIKSKVGTVMDVFAGASANGTNVQMYKQNGTNAQKWKLVTDVINDKNIVEGDYVLQSALDGNKVMEVANSSNADGANVQLNDNSNKTNQRFSVVYVGEGYYKIICRQSEKSLDVFAGSDAAGINLQQYSWNNSDAQLWKFIDAGDGTYYIQSKVGTVVDVYAGSTMNGTNIQMYSLNHSTAQRWNLSSGNEIAAPLADGVYSIRSKINESKMLDIYAGSEENGANVQVYDSNGTTSQNFLISYQGDGYYKVISEKSGKSLDVSGGSTANKANLQQYTWNESDAQLWKLVYSQDGAYTIQSKLGTYISADNANLDNGTNVLMLDNCESDISKWNFKQILYTNIMGKSVTTVDQMVNYYNSVAIYPSYYASSNSDAPTLKDFCQIIYDEATVENVRAEIVFAQAMNETGYLKFGHDVGIEQFNFAGIGATGNGVKGNSFSSVREGIRVQVQHLKAYASTDPLVNPKVDPRFDYVTRGIAPYVEWLGIQENPYNAGWAAAVNYGNNLVKKYMNPLLFS